MYQILSDGGDHMPVKWEKENDIALSTAVTANPEPETVGANVYPAGG